MLILSDKLYQERFFSDPKDNVLVGVSESGYNNDDLAYDYIHHFNRQSRKYQQGLRRILLCDEYGSHLTREILEFCAQQKIHIFPLPPHTSHILQPLDVILFQPFKHFHAKAVDQATQTGCSKFTKLEILTPISSIRRDTFKKNFILSSFRECGLIPYNPQVVLAKVRDYQAPPPLN